MLRTSQLLVDHFKCADLGVEFECPDPDGLPTGFFRFGDDVVCYAAASAIPVAGRVGESLHDTLRDVHIDTSPCVLPFDPAEVADNLRRERYVHKTVSKGEGFLPRLMHSAYYAVRPLLPVAVRRHFQQHFLAERPFAPFPTWPVDRTVDRFLENLLALALKAKQWDRIPFIWFWPEGQFGAAVITHDVETGDGLRFCTALMDVDEEFGIRSSFQFIPEDRYAVPELLLGEMRRRGFEINVHDLNHDGRLYWNQNEFLRRAAKINSYVRQFGANGFRSGVLYRNLDWYHSFDFSYDMSVPNVGHLDPQPGGCCTVMPYFIGQILELPLTTTQDYPLFQILREYSIELWMRQINLIEQGHGLISFNTHPDYLIEGHALTTYRALLNHLANLRTEMGLWFALPGEVNAWWRARSQMQLVQENGAWRIEGPGKERARIAFACLDGDNIRFTIGPPVEDGSAPEQAQSSL